MALASSRPAHGSLPGPTPFPAQHALKGPAQCQYRSKSVFCFHNNLLKAEPELESMGKTKSHDVGIVLYAIGEYDKNLDESFVIAVSAIVMATYSTGIDSKAFMSPKNSFDLDDEVPYGYGFFHFVFAIGSMYFAMLFVGWNLQQTMHK